MARGGPQPPKGLQREMGRGKGRRRRIRTFLTGRRAPPLRRRRPGGRRGQNSSGMVISPIPLPQYKHTFHPIPRPPHSGALILVVQIALEPLVEGISLAAFCFSEIHM